MPVFYECFPRDSVCLGTVKTICTFLFCPLFRFRVLKKRVLEDGETYQTIQTSRKLIFEAILFHEEASFREGNQREEKPKEEKYRRYYSFDSTKK